MIDIHNHILPGIDDGSPDIASSLQMAKQLVSLGYSSVLASSHIQSGVYKNDREKIEAKCSELQKEIKKASIPMEIIPFAEVYLDETVLTKLKNGLIPIYNHRILVEAPMYSWPSYIDTILFQIQTMGIIPIIAHIERNQKINRKIDHILSLKEEGIEIQVEYRSIIGFYGLTAKTCVTELFRKSIPDYIATDMHYPAESMDDFIQAKSAIMDIIGEEKWMENQGRRLKEDVLIWN